LLKLNRAAFGPLIARLLFLSRFSFLFYYHAISAAMY
jgi:hypothetical protein